MAQQSAEQLSKKDSIFAGSSCGQCDSTFESIRNQDTLRENNEALEEIWKGNREEWWILDWKLALSRGVEWRWVVEVESGVDQLFITRTRMQQKQGVIEAPRAPG